MNSSTSPMVVYKVAQDQGSFSMTYYPAEKDYIHNAYREKYNIAFNPHLATLNSRNEIFGPCMHIQEMLVGQPPG